ncbi:MAG: hypothetical protein UU93_C0003G0059 [Candidatus Amesbacteria bacterium GW2011_GWA2_42_12]|uniref:Uncharacterized protein n=1 Tax=Candidatus Amesbacteria bacterium GW2011_GWA2_42_12 TaxID=1618356 RepID=A0A0G1AG01_9BACT|nr:MAG: hypothetical protein UU93_C0003G0059 [Candidatus Amesbacteria bacterium GW2011_GWA2_42_12]
MRKYFFLIIIFISLVFGLYLFKSRIFKPQDLLKKHLTAQVAINSYRVESSSSDRPQATTTEVQFKNNRFYLKTDQFVIVDNTAYYKNASGQWQLAVLPLDQASAYNRFRPEVIRQNYQNYQINSKFEGQGKDKCGQLNCHKYFQTDASSSATRTFWFDNKEYLLRHDIFKLGEFTSENLYSYDNINIDIPL